MSDWVGITIALVTLFLDLLIVAVGGVWVVSNIKAATERLSATIDHLSSNVTRQQSWLDTLEDKVQNHGERIAVIEAKTTAEIAATIAAANQAVAACSTQQQQQEGA